MIDYRQLPTIYSAFRNRWSERDERVETMDLAVTGDWRSVGPDEESLDSASPNLVQVALEDTAESASLRPSVRLMPSKPTNVAKDKASKMERLAASYMELSQWPLLSIKSLMDLAGFGYFAWVVTYDEESQSPYLQWRDPRTCYPSPGWLPGDSVRECLFTRHLYLNQLPEMYRSRVMDSLRDKDPNSVINLQRKVVVVEHFDESHITVAALLQNSLNAASNILGRSNEVSYTPVLLDQTETPGGICPVVMVQRITLDGEPRGQFDQVIPVMQAHIKLMSMVIDYADQSVYSDIWVKDLIGEMPYGGGAYIQLGPQGSIGRVPPAVSSLSVQQEMEQLIANIHLGGRWPKSRPGEIDQAIASAKFLEASSGMMNTVIRTYHYIMATALTQAMNICFKVDMEVGKDRTVAGVLKNQQFLHEHSKSDIDPKARPVVEYGAGLGRDPAQAVVIGIQMQGAGFVSKEFVQENYDGLMDVQRERERIDAEKLSDIAWAQLLQGVTDGTIPKTALAEIFNARMKGAEIVDLYDKYVARPAADQAAQQLTSGLGGPPGMPGQGGPAGPGGMMAPPPPDMAAMLGGAGAPAPNEPPSSIGRLSVPLGGGSFAGSQSGG